MNKIYKLVWNQVRGCYVVASEFAKAHGKSARRAVVGAFVATAMVGGMGTANAAPTGEGAVIQGYEVEASRTSTAWGARSMASGETSTAWGDGSTASGEMSTAWGCYSTASGEMSTAWGIYSMASGKLSTAWGGYSKAIGETSTAFGNESKAWGNNSLAGLGGTTGQENSKDFGYGAVAIGEGSLALAKFTYAIGNGATATLNNALALGNGAIAKHYNSVALGSGSVTDRDNCISIGNRQISFVRPGHFDTDAATVGQVREEKNRALAAEQANADAITAETVRAMTAEEANKKAIAELATGKLLGDVENFKLGDAFTGELVETKEGKKYFAMDINEYGNIKFADMGKENLNVVLSGNGFYAQDSDATTRYETSLDEKGLMIKAGDSKVSITAKGVDLGGSKITNVAAGEVDTDAVNLAQLKAEANRAQAAEQINADAIAVETKRAQTIEQANTNAISNEIARATAAESILDGKVDYATGLALENKHDIESAFNTQLLDETKIEFGTGLEGKFDKEKNTYTIQVKNNINDTLHFAKEAYGAEDNGVDISGDGLVAYKVVDGVGYQTEVNENGIKIEKGERAVNITAEGIDLGGGAITGVSAIGINNTVADSVKNSSIAVGHNNKVTGSQSTAVGYNNTVNGNNSGAFGDPTIINADNSYSVGNNNIIAAGQHDVFVLGNQVAKTASNSVVLGNGSEATEENVVSVGSADNKRKIVNVADPENPTDAVNLRTLEAKIGNTEALDAISNRVNRLDSKINRTGAHAAALAALRPADFDGKLSVAAGLGNYHGSQAGAIGLFYKPTDRISFNLGGTMGGKENMANFGISFALDRVVPHGISSRGELNKKLQSLSAENAEMKALVANQTAENAAMKAENAEMKAHIAKQDAKMAELEAMVLALAKK